MSQTAGFLWDSLTPNIGDQAIGLTLLRLAARKGVDRLRPVCIGEPVPGEHAILVVGGGELLTTPGHGYYDLFRPPGEHVLCSVGTSGALEDVSYLQSYRLVSVRSEWDLANLADLRREVEVAPCLTVLFSEVAEASGRPSAQPGALGLHVNAATVSGGGRALYEALRDMDLNQAAFFSFTHYNRDSRLESVLSEALQLPAPIVPSGADEAFELIRSLRAVVATSLHATLFAYVSGIPFLSFAYSPKVRAFAEERGLGDRLLTSVGDLRAREHLLAPETVDWSDRLEEDRRRAHHLLDKVLTEVDRALSAPRRFRRRSVRWLEPTHPLHAHQAMMEHYAEFGTRIAERTAFELEQEKIRHYVDDTSGHLASVRSALSSAEAYARHLERELDSAHKAYQQLAEHAAIVSAEMETARAQRDELSERIERGESERVRRRKDLADSSDFAVRDALVDAEEYVRHLERELGNTRSEYDRLAEHSWKSAAEIERLRTRLEAHGEQGQQHTDVLLQELEILRHSKALAEERAGFLEAIMARRTVHAVIVHHRGREILERCLESLLASRGPSIQVVVVANSCQEPLPELVESSDRIHLVESTVSLGFAAANNLGVRWARENLGEPNFYFFLNNDTVVEPDTLERLVCTMAEEPRCGIVGPLLKIWGATDFLNSVGLQMTWWGEAWDEGIGRSFDEYRDRMARGKVLAVTGSALVIRGEVFQALGGWEEIYGYYYEDLDLCLRCWSQGWRVVHEPEAVMYHAISATAEARSDFKLYLTWRNRILLLLIYWPASFLLRWGPMLLGRELALLGRRIRVRAYRDARVQARSWAGALLKVPAALRRRWRAGGNRDWTRFLHPPGSVPEIHLPDPALRGTLAAEDEPNEATS